MLHVHLVRPPVKTAWDHLLKLLDANVVMTSGASLPEHNVEVLVDGRPSKEQLGFCHSLQALVIPYAGLPKETRDLLLAVRPELAVYNLHHNAASASELALALLLAAAKTLIPVDRAFREHDWRSRYDGAPTILLHGKTAVILGFGAIGSRIANACNALGMNVHAVRRHVEASNVGPIAIHNMEGLPSLLPQADVLCIALPLTDETEGLIGAEQIDRLPASCVLVNVARGAIVDEESLYDALRDGKIAAAGLDVWYSYPQTREAQAKTSPSRFPFHELDNVVMSPHRGGAFGLQELEHKRMTDLAQLLNAMARNALVPSRVDLLAGY